MDIEQQFQKVVESVGNVDSPSDEHRRRLREQVLAAMDVAGPTAMLSQPRRVIRPAWPAGRLWLLGAAGVAAAAVVIVLLAVHDWRPRQQNTQLVQHPIVAAQEARGWPKLMFVENSDSWTLIDFSSDVPVLSYWPNNATEPALVMPVSGVAARGQTQSVPATNS